MRLTGLILVILVMILAALLLPRSGLAGWTAAVQTDLHRHLVHYISGIRTAPWTHGLTLMGICFLYGIFHAIGPGHGKAVIVGYLGTQRAALWHGVVVSWWAALLQAMVAIGLVAVVMLVWRLTFAEVQRFGGLAEQIGYGLVVLLGNLIVWRAIYRQSEPASSMARMPSTEKESLFFVSKAGPGAVNGWSIQSPPPQSQAPRKPQSLPMFAKPGFSSQAPIPSPREAATWQSAPLQRVPHSGGKLSGCDCQHAYLPPPDATRRQRILVALSMGARPCSGALMVLLYAHLTGTWWHGVLATLAMAAGTGLSVSAIAVVTVVCRERLLRLLWRGRASDTASLIFWQRALALIGGLLLMSLGVVLWSGAQVAGQVHPLFPG